MGELRPFSEMEDKIMLTARARKYCVGIPLHLPSLMKIDLYVLHMLGGKVTTEIVILQMQLEFLKITSIPVYKAATDCTVTMETCSRVRS